MEKIITHIETAARWMDMIPVSGAQVDYMACARQELRLALKEAKSSLDGNEESNG